MIEEFAILTNVNVFEVGQNEADKVDIVEADTQCCSG